MKSEYVRFESDEKKVIGKKLLTSQLLLLDSLKRHKSFKALRSEEIMLKIALRTKIEHLNNDLASFERLMPKPTIKPKNLPVSEEVREDLTLEEEIDLLKRKIERLNS